MRPRTILASVILILACGLMLSAWASAEVVGHITQAEGRVDLLKGGKLPATPVKLQDKVESGDVLRTKSLSKAQITFIDNSIITLSPDSRLAVDEYQFNPAQQKRNVVLNLFQGMAHVVVNKLFKVSEPDFVIKTFTAVTGVRGTEFGIRLQPNGSTILNFEGVLQVGNIFPEVGQLPRKAFKVAYSSSRQWGESAHGWVRVPPWYGVFVGSGLPPTVPFHITPEDRKQFMNQMTSGLMSRKSGQGSGSGSTAGSSSGSGSGGSSADSGTGGTGSGTAGAGAGVAGGGTEFMTNLGGPDSGLGTPVSTAGTAPSSVPLVAPMGLTTGTGNTAITTLNTVTVPPVDTSTQTASLPAPSPPVTPPVVEPPGTTTPTAATYAFTQTGQSTWTSTTASPYTTTTVTSTGWGLRTGITTATAQALPDSYAGYYTASGTGDRTVVQGSLYYSSTSTGVTTSTLTGIVTGVSGGTLTGTATMTGSSSFGQTTSFTGTVSIDPSGVLTFNYGGSNGTATNTSQARLASAIGTNTYTPGTYFTQSLNGLMSNTASAPYTTQSTSTTLAGATTTSGPLAPYYALTLTGGQTSPWAYWYLGQNYNSIESTFAGVVNPTTLHGAATIIPTYNDSSFVSLLATPPSPYLFGRGANDILPIVSTVSIDPSTGVLSGTIHTTDYQDGKYASGVYPLTQTPQTSPVAPVSGTSNFAETYTGNIWFNGSSSGAPLASMNSSGYGYRSADGPLAPYLNGYFGSYANGAYTVNSGSMPPYGYGSALFTGSGTTAATTLLSGTVTGTAGQNLTGTMTWIGSLLNGPSFNYSGTVTIDSSGYLRFTYGNGSGSATWMYPGGPSGTASGWMDQWAGYHFTQTVPGTYQLTTTSAYQGTLTLSGSSASRPADVVYGGSLGPFSGSFRVDSPSGSLSPVSGSIDSALSQIEGVVGTSWLGANSGPASLTLTAATPGVFSVTVPGQISLVPGGSYFTANGGLTPTSAGAIQVSSSSGPGTIPTGLAQLPLYGFSETYQGFRIGTGSAPFTLANVEGYGWGSITGSSVFGTTPTTSLPTSYTGGSTTGYFVSQDLGTRASLSAMTPGWVGVKGTMTGILSGTAGQTLTGQMLFTGTNSAGATLNYQGNASLASNGTLVWNYYGNWTNGANTGTANGEWTQVLGTYFKETVNSGSFVQAATSTTIGGTTYASKTVQDVGPLGGTRTIGAGSPTTVSYAGIRTSTVNTFNSGGGTPNLTVQGVVAGSSWETRWGVATISGTGAFAGSTTGISGPVTLDPTGKLTGQFVDVIPNGATQPADNVTVNLVSVPAGSGQTTSSFVQTVSGTVTQTPTSSTQGSLTTATPLSGTGTGTIPGNINANVNLTSTAASATYVTAGTGPMSAQIIGAVGGPAGGTQTGVASMHSIKTIGANTRALQHLGTATHQPAVGSTPATLTTNLNGLNPTRSGVFANQTGTVTVTPKP